MRAAEAISRRLQAPRHSSPGCRMTSQMNGNRTGHDRGLPGKPLVHIYVQQSLERIRPGVAGATSVPLPVTLAARNGRVDTYRVCCRAVSAGRGTYADRAVRVV